jgi:hypothetical protein
MVVNGGFECFCSVILLNGAHALIPWVFPKPIHRFRSNTISENKRTKIEQKEQKNKKTT